MFWCEVRRLSAGSRRPGAAVCPRPARLPSLCAPGCLKMTLEASGGRLGRVRRRGRRTCASFLF